MKKETYELCIKTNPIPFKVYPAEESGLAWIKYGMYKDMEDKQVVLLHRIESDDPVLRGLWLYNDVLKDFKFIR